MWLLLLKIEKIVQRLTDTSCDIVVISIILYFMNINNDNIIMVVE